MTESSRCKMCSRCTLRCPLPGYAVTGIVFIVYITPGHIRQAKISFNGGGETSGLSRRFEDLRVFERWRRIVIVR